MEPTTPAERATASEADQRARSMADQIDHLRRMIDDARRSAATDPYLDRQAMATEDVEERGTTAPSSP